MKNIQQEVINGNINPYELLDFWNENPLDKEDIESLGFTLDKISKNENQEIYFKDNIVMYYRYNTHQLGIITKDPSKNDYYSKYNKDPYSIHSITIKNKSELIKLLKQLEIG